MSNVFNVQLKRAKFAFDRNFATHASQAVLKHKGTTIDLKIAIKKSNFRVMTANEC